MHSTQNLQKCALELDYKNLLKNPFGEDVDCNFTKTQICFICFLMYQMMFIRGSLENFWPRVYSNNPLQIKFKSYLDFPSVPYKNTGH